GEIRREDLQDLLDHKAPVLSFSVVDHLRWHLRAIYDLAISEGATDRNPAFTLVTPKCKADRNAVTISRCVLPKSLKTWSGRRDSNPRRPAWEAGILPLNYSRSGVGGTRACRALKSEYTTIDQNVS